MNTNATNIVKLKYLGSVSHGTMLTEDLIPTFHNVLHDIDSERAERLQADIAFTVLGESENVDADDILHELFDILDEYAPDGYYFGAHVGDGSDYGFWPTEEGDE